MSNLSTNLGGSKNGPQGQGPMLIRVGAQAQQTCRQAFGPISSPK